MSIEDQEILSEKNFRIFIDSGRTIDDIGKELGIEELDGVCGRLYMDDLFIQCWGSNWLLEIGNEEYSEVDGYSLSDLEYILFDWAESDGHFK